MTGLRELVEAVREARAAAAGPRCDHSKDTCLRCDRCRLHASVTRPVLSAMVAAVRLSEFLLSTPDVLAAVEAHPDAMEALAAVRQLGEARAAKRTAQDAVNAAWGTYYDARRANSGDLDTRCGEWLRAADANQHGHDAWSQANSTLCALADRLAAREDDNK